MLNGVLNLIYFLGQLLIRMCASVILYSIILSISLFLEKNLEVNHYYFH